MSYLDQLAGRWGLFSYSATRGKGADGANGML